MRWIGKVTAIPEPFTLPLTLEIGLRISLVKLGATLPQGENTGGPPPRLTGEQARDIFRTPKSTRKVTEKCRDAEAPTPEAK